MNEKQILPRDLCHFFFAFDDLKRHLFHSVFLLIDKFKFRTKINTLGDDLFIILSKCGIVIFKYVAELKTRGLYDYHSFQELLLFFTHRFFFCVMIAVSADVDTLLISPRNVE